MLRLHARPVPVVPSAAFNSFRFPPEIIVLAVRWYLRFGLPYRDVEELLAERGIEVDQVTVTGGCSASPPLLVDAARALAATRSATGSSTRPNPAPCRLPTSPTVTDAGSSSAHSDELPARTH
jgi:hypothetical protein